MSKLILLLLILGYVSAQNYRLNNEVIPSKYTISLTPNFDAAQANTPLTTFSGVVAIIIRATTPVTTIRLHSKKLTIQPNGITLTQSGSLTSMVISSISAEDAITEMRTIALEIPMTINVDYTLRIQYTGIINDDMTGLYRSSYNDDGVKSWVNEKIIYVFF